MTAGRAESYPAEKVQDVNSNELREEAREGREGREGEIIMFLTHTNSIS